MLIVVFDIKFIIHGLYSHQEFGDNKDLNFNDLKKLIFSKSKQVKGKISYEDFSAWMGNCIHMSEGFYFRHDSIRNPGYEIVQQLTKKSMKNQDKIREDITMQNTMRTIIAKIYEQWKTIRKAFSDMNKDTSAAGYLSHNELMFYFTHWGLKMTD